MKATIRLNLGLHPGQREVLADPARFKVLAKGRRWGGSRLAARYLLEGALAGEPTAWVFPTYKMGTPQWRLMKRLISRIPQVRKSEVERTVEFPGGGYLVFKSADREDDLRGDGYKRVALDEAAFLRESAWFNEIRPSLADLEGSALILSSPKTQANWFYRLYTRAKILPGWAAWTFPTSTNPYIKASEIEEARLSMPDYVFRQEYLAEFLESGGSLFTNILDQAKAKGQDGRAVDPETEEDAGHEYVAGLDLARLQTYTVLTIMDLNLDLPSAVFIDRFNRMSWRQMIARIKESILLYGVERLVVDATGVGDPVTERIAEEVGDVCTVDPYVISLANKPFLIEELALAIERGDLEYILDPDLITELQALEPTVTATGRAKYKAAEGYFDDMVISLALAWHAATTGRLMLDMM